MRRVTRDTSESFAELVGDNVSIGTPLLRRSSMPNLASRRPASANKGDWMLPKRSTSKVITSQVASGQLSQAGGLGRGAGKSFQSRVLQSAGQAFVRPAMLASGDTQKPGASCAEQQSPSQRLPQRRRTTDDSTKSELVWIARANCVPLETCQEAAKLFQAHEPNLKGALNHEQFSEVVLRLSGLSSVSQLPQDMLSSAFKIVDKDKNGAIDFSEFVTWYYSRSFDTNFFISEDERKIRDFCATHGLSAMEMDQYKKFFEEFDVDGSGGIDQEEFEALLKKCAKVPDSAEIPAKRFQQLWNEADADGGGTIDLMEFCLFYRKYFGQPDAVANGFEGWYRNIRKV